MMNIYQEIQIILLRRGWSVRKLARQLIEAGYSKIPKNGGLSNKFNAKTIRFEEVQTILDYLGYELIIREKR